jgi:hypothetical protein
MYGNASSDPRPPARDRLQAASITLRWVGGCCGTLTTLVIGAPSSRLAPGCLASCGQTDVQAGGRDWVGWSGVQDPFAEPADVFG